MNLAYNYLAKLFSFESNLEKDLMRLARVEYGRDWEWAYTQLVEGKNTTKGSYIVSSTYWWPVTDEEWEELNYPKKKT